MSTFQPCIFVALNDYGNFLFETGDKVLTFELSNAKVLKNKIGALQELMAVRGEQTSFECKLVQAKEPVFYQVQFLAWRDKSGHVWKDFGLQLIELEFAEERK